MYISTAKVTIVSQQIWTQRVELDWKTKPKLS